jgi:multidrug efflux pump subunit AcrB
MVPLLGTEFVPKGDYSEATLAFQTPVGTSLESTALKAKQVEKIVREFPEVEYTLTGMNTPNAQGKTAPVFTFVWWIENCVSAAWRTLGLCCENGLAKLPALRLPMSAP